jgi:plastocyanin
VVRTTFLYRPGHRRILALAALVLAVTLSIAAVLLSAALADEAPGPVEVPPAAQEAAAPETPAMQTSPPAEAMPVQEAAPQAPEDPFLVRMEDNVFIPQELAVPPGTTVTWVNAGADDHTIVAADLSFDSGVIKPGQSWQRVFEAPGEYPYICDLHENMEGKILVQ